MSVQRAGSRRIDNHRKKKTSNAALPLERPGQLPRVKQGEKLGLPDTVAVLHTRHCSREPPKVRLPGAWVLFREPEILSCGRVNLILAVEQLIRLCQVAISQLAAD